jgi:hypothetical protein
MRIPFSILLQQVSNPSQSSWSVVRSATVERNMQMARQIIVGFKPGFWTNGSDQTKQACVHGPGTTIIWQGPLHCFHWLDHASVP